ncbi:hypothetical protein NSE01_41140 [Novosphingobium sediminis]|uniref:Uncharacterized protein n=1 Tax=Novosphingobium sediminis TaxID=707214 RepID=A0A512ARI2_9SPHN|nr:hypothetical protein NSE01_41140 [Novosphingobium sediminis]
MTPDRDQPPVTGAATRAGHIGKARPRICRGRAFSFARTYRAPQNYRGNTVSKREGGEAVQAKEA